MGDGLPTPRDGTQRYLKAIHDRLGDVEGRLGEMLDRLPPSPPPTGGEGEVELREPAVPAPEGGRGVSSGPVEDTGGSGAAVRPARSSTPRRRSPKPSAVAEPAPVKASKTKSAPRRTTKTTTAKPTPKKGEDT